MRMSGWSARDLTWACYNLRTLPLSSSQPTPQPQAMPTILRVTIFLIECADRNRHWATVLGIPPAHCPASRSKRPESRGYAQKFYAEVLPTNVDCRAHMLYAPRPAATHPVLYRDLMTCTLSKAEAQSTVFVNQLAAQCRAAIRVFMSKVSDRTVLSCTGLSGPVG